MKKVLTGARGSVTAARIHMPMDAQLAESSGSGLRRARAAGCLVVFAAADLSREERLSSALADCGARPHPARDPLDLRRMIASPACAVAVVDLPPEVSESAAALESMRCLREHGFVVIACADGSASWTIGQRCRPLLAGASELLDSSRPCFTAELRELLDRIVEGIAAERDERERICESMQSLGIIGTSAAMLSVFRTTLRVSKLSDVPVLITGETGTGKGLLAQAIHRLDPKRSSGPFVALNCGAISTGVAESELFGHRRGAFTGADRDRKGLFRSAQGGVLFLDEIGEMDLQLQVKLLRVLQEGRVLAVGEETESTVNLRVIAATNRDLPQMVSEHKFRADLYHRLNVVSVNVPPLRDRRSDARPLVEHFIGKHRSLCPDPEVALSPEFIQAIEMLDYPGNARELEHLLCHALVHKQPGSPLKLVDLPPGVWRQLTREPAEENEPERRRVDSAEGSSTDDSVVSAVPPMVGAESWRLPQFLEHCEKLLLENALRRTSGNQAETARLLGITARSVYNKLRKHRLRS